jgi:hypothetical protein
MGENIQPMLAVNWQSMSFNINGESFDVQCVVTKHGHLLINASQYAAAFIGCDLKSACHKLVVVAGRVSELNHSKRRLLEHDKVLPYFIPSL